MSSQFTSRRRGLAALALAVTIGAAVAVIVGYFVYVAPRAEGAMTFERWLAQPIRFSAYRWAVVGALLGAAIAYFRRLDRG